MAKLKPELREECRRLRSEERCSVKEIAKKTGAALSSVSTWVRDIKLTSEELEVRKAKRVGVGLTATSWWREKPDSKLLPLWKERGLTNAERGRAAEAAVKWRLICLGYNIYVAPYEGATLDGVIGKEGSNKVCRLQIKSLFQDKNYGNPVIYLRCSDGYGKSKRIINDSFDLAVGYSHDKDIACVFLSSELKEVKTSVSVTQSSEEAWHKLESFFSEELLTDIPDKVTS